MQKGFILIFVMVLLGLSALLLILPWQQYVHHKKILNIMALETKLSFLMEQDILKLLNQLKESQGQMVHGRYQFSYQIIDKGCPPCLLIKNKSHTVTAHLWLILLKSQTRMISVVAATLGKPLTNTCASQKKRLIKPGLQSWFNEALSG